MMLHQDIHSAEVSVVIVAGGQGVRMGASVPKQFLLLQGKPLLWHTVQRFSLSLPLSQIIVVVPSDHIHETQKWLEGIHESLLIVKGGESRYHSVEQGLKHAQQPFVMVHDGVRSMISEKLIHRCYFTLKQKGNAIPVVLVSDSIRMLDGDTSKALDRNLLRAVQTPQCFKTSDLLIAFQQPYQTLFTDEASMMELQGHQLHLVEGEKSNLKITTMEDLLLAEALLQSI